jgi:hypothetical protein
MKTPHKHAEIIHAWADGAEIEFREVNSDDTWKAAALLLWCAYFEYRIKPEPKPEDVFYCHTDQRGFNYFYQRPSDDDNLKLTFDGETGKLIKAEVI